MLFPTVSVTGIGLIARRSQPLRTMLLGVIGAWLGFIVGAIFGVVIDVIAQTGTYVAIVGHLTAIVGAIVALVSFRGYRT